MELIDSLISDLKNNKDVSLENFEYIINLSYNIFKKEPNVIHTKSPITLLGDVHGDFEDVLEIFEIFGTPPEGRYVFIGDFVDRGPKSVHTLALLLCYKIKYPEDFILIRGNHEGTNLTYVFGFYREMIKRYGDIHLFHQCIEMFTTLPLAIIIDNNILSIHGGLSAKLETIEQLNSIDRETPDTGMTINKDMILKDILWNDPTRYPGIQPSNREGGLTWGPDITERFCSKNGIKLIVRGHESISSGYRWDHNGRVLTIFSSPYYNNEFHEGAALEIISPEKLEITMFRPKFWENNIDGAVKSRLLPIFKDSTSC